MSQAIGFVGLGNMGAPMAGRLVDAGHPLIVHDQRPQAAAPFAARGCEVAPSLKALAERAELVFLSLPTPEVVAAVARELAGGGALKRVVDLSTTGPTVSRAIETVLAEGSSRLIDCPVSGGVGGARAGTLAVMAACSDTDFADLQPLLKVFGRPFHVGRAAGMGQMMKLVNNLLSASALALSGEAIVLGAKAGLAPATMVDVINASTGRNSATQDKFPKAILPGTFDAGFASGLMLKDVRLCLQEAQAMGVAMRGAAGVLALWERAVAELGGDADFTRIVNLFERDNGVEVRG